MFEIVGTKAIHMITYRVIYRQIYCVLYSYSANLQRIQYEDSMGLNRLVKCELKGHER